MRTPFDVSRTVDRRVLADGNCVAAKAAANDANGKLGRSWLQQAVVYEKTPSSRRLDGVLLSIFNRGFVF
ncbi:hypothetical protein EDM54_09650 [Brevibacillus borstelensis]|uniref:Uncharacterized protein n=1 Tax=Brevibacillus borstelensis AK1 TaxID=1300222 RepID=M8D9H2_9BACL|nr:hypothetical protein I532_09077 [Brevibacillus borstelensis AK1]KKX55667.1 hypothetical protein X546_08365 [Brevibacillus borstelensis cifa_chp40]RNB63570.1 hypothetical protein EDM54_09650 [Brevibacillus borstelensis]